MKGITEPCLLHLLWAAQESLYVIKHVACHRRKKKKKILQWFGPEKGENNAKNFSDFS